MTDIPAKIKADAAELMDSLSRLGDSAEVQAAKASVSSALDWVKQHLVAQGQAQPMPTEEDQKPKGPG